LKAYDFEYDGRRLSDFGCMICSFDSKGMETVSNGALITFNTLPMQGGSRYELTSTIYEDCLEATIQICKNTCSGNTSEIYPHEFRELTRWLSRKKFLKFKILDDNYWDLYFEASFNISRIEIDGKLIGLELQVLTNRPFALKEPKTINVRTKKLYIWDEYNKTDNNEMGEPTGKTVTSYDRNLYPDNGIFDGYFYIYKEETNVASIFDISHEEGYIYPYTEIIIDNIEDIPVEKRHLTIYNALEDRSTYIANCVSGEIITMDYPMVKSSVASHSIQNDFNWNFFRVANTYENRRNDLTTSLPCTIKIRYSPIIKVGL
jgi:hypothetical protein